MAKRVLIKIPCVICGTLYTTRQAKKLIYPGTGVCYQCYSDGVKAHPDSWCLGKRYNSETKDCGTRCPDKGICRLITQKRIQL